ncbi:sodium- and chloride-dependent glycine transporter 1-like [Asterias rubens]|uniref:sodium- and chloride-dependent glycine transporter 1-like n=1 Tax=Asterias rubens TaxID=7604 RepID=UPI001455BED7|nr:sodium- and chloride-dependent glycine transporter 1-like [Asterias rubens]
MDTMKEKMELESVVLPPSKDDEDSTGRGKWSGKLDFILSSMGYAIGLGNVWRFPYLCYSNGGGAFLFPYLIMLFLVGFPILFLEISFGQFGSLGCISMWRISPLFKGIGFGMVLMSGYFCLYYNIIIAYSAYYMFASFLNPLPWVGCNHTFNTDACFDGSQGDGILECPMNPNFTGKTKPVFASEEYFERRVLQISDSLGDIGYIQWEILLCFIFVWIVVFICISKGVKTSGKVVYFTATFPYLGLLTLLIVGALQPGAVNGILYFITPQFDKLLDIQVWKAAANQVVFSFGAGWGGLHTLSSYNKFNNNTFRDTVIIVVSGGLTSIFAGFVVFSIIGFMACDAQVPIEQAIDAGPGLAFVAYPEAIARVPVIPQLWSFIFFFMLITLGLDSQFVTLETIITAVMDELEYFYPNIRKRKTLVIFSVCFIMLLAGLPFTTQGGIYLMTLFDWYSAGYSPMILALAELFVFDCIYGLSRFIREVGVMIGSKPSFIWKVMWYIVTPILIIFPTVYGFIEYTPAQYGDYVFPGWAEAIGWTMTASSLICVFIYAAYFLIWRVKGSFIQRIRTAIQPAPEWGPALDEDRAAAGYQPYPKPTVEIITKDYDNIAFTSDSPPEYNGMHSVCVGTDDIDISEIL